MNYYNIVIVRYGEIFLKSEYVRKKLVNKLVVNIVLKLKKKNISHRIIKKRHRIYIESDDARNLEKIAHEVKDVLGVVSVSPAARTDAEMEKMTNAAVKLSKNLIGPDDSYAVRTHRTGRHDFTSMDVDREIGAKIQKETNAKVDLAKPGKTIFIDIIFEFQQIPDMPKLLSATAAAMPAQWVPCPCSSMGSWSL